MNTEVVVLAAGRGTRMRSSLPKVLHEIGGTALLEHVLRAVDAVNPTQVHVVVGAGHQQVREHFASRDVNWVLQAEQKGTGHAVAQAFPSLERQSLVVVLYGDVPMVQSATLAALIEAASVEAASDEEASDEAPSDGALALVTADVADPSGLGRIVRDAAGRVRAIVEERDARSEELAIHEINGGILALDARLLGRWIGALAPNNAQGEYYLTDLVKFAVRDGIEIRTVAPAFEEEVWGVNNPEELARVERAYQRRLAKGQCEPRQALDGWKRRKQKR